MNDTSTLAALVCGAGKWAILGSLFAALTVAAPSCSSKDDGDSNGSGSGNASGDGDDADDDDDSSTGGATGSSSADDDDDDDTATGGTDDSGSAGSSSTTTSGTETVSLYSDVPFSEACPSITEDLGDCGSSATAARQKWVNVMLVVDKSGSMDAVPAGYNESLWLSVSTALGNVLSDVQDRIAFGLELYPFPQTDSVPITSDCDQAGNCCEMPLDDDMNVPIGSGEDHVATIVSTLENTLPGGGTPTAEALRRAGTYLQSMQNRLEGETYIVLATDGGPNCNGDITCEPQDCTMHIGNGACIDEPADINCCGPTPEGCLDSAATVSALENLNALGIKTYVVGIPGSEPYEPALNEFAIAGGVPNEDPDDPDAPRYYQVSAAGGVNALQATFERITEQLVTSCEIPLAEVPPDTQRVNVAIDCAIIPQESSDGTTNWSLSDDNLSLIIEGEECEAISTSGVDRLDVLLGCPPMGIG